MNPFLSKATLLALSIMSSTAMASHWSYEGEGSPEHWGALSEEYKTCQTGMNQSPINIDQSANAHLKPLKTHYTEGPITLINNGHTIQAALKSATADTITIDGTPFTLQQFHFHAPSENTVHGKHYAMEMHLVHKDANGAIAVVAVMFDKGAANTELDKLWATMPEQTGQDANVTSQMDLNALLPKNKRFWRFSGSLTTPPCSEGVTWIVMKHPLTLSAAQLEKFSHTMHHDNNRPPQPLNGRVVVE
ncbi:TPA: carbonic anhydrase family protein [Citrobacter amalonaticus]|uniref:carbonic anhydrase n=1 Tax=Citrobacter TaxID=544 RepID=UPI0004A14CAF|nr:MULTISPECIES: carbonic anhydrase family protein [Citrobacter]AUZ63608.1 carbonic anhydrase [Citrobacter sp. CFNIH10]EKY5004677.1 carbonic anhydrase family protein [Citrobacter amalonaticus]ELN9499812.1 carbonic anhydrase family protein [Citrobacter amalonaticus]ELW9347065.1 carbonic anhydrase family protein [Citrobacter amalonaticus]KDF12433.1 carbonic anhydrase [Citrobacter sp. MGH 55]